jgi:hypothetical protein
MSSSPELLGCYIKEEINSLNKLRGIKIINNSFNTVNEVYVSTIMYLSNSFYM